MTAVPHHAGSAPPSDRIEIRSEIPGTVIRLDIAPGDTVAAGDAIALLESMKMEIPVLSEGAGTIREVLVGAGDVVPADHLIATVVAHRPRSAPTSRAVS